jgi:hypothetical protein
MATLDSLVAVYHFPYSLYRGAPLHLARHTFPFGLRHSVTPYLPIIFCALVFWYNICRRMSAASGHGDSDVQITHLAITFLLH